MKCPSCKDKNLVPNYTEQGVEIDYCPDCRGVWLDKGEIFYFTQKPSELQKELDEAIKLWKPSEKICPRTGKNMDEITLPKGQVILDYSPHSRGIWFDGGELEKLTEEPCPPQTRPPRLLEPLPSLCFLTSFCGLPRCLCFYMASSPWSLYL